MLMRKSSTAKAEEKLTPPAPKPQELSNVPAEEGGVVLRIALDGKRSLLEIETGGVARLDIAAARMLRNEINRFLEANGAK